ncbi:MAG: DUF3035 domain-containing protein [Amaricoccus sp.]
MRAGKALACLALAVAAAVPLAGCKGDNTLAGGLRAAGVGGSPDEFMVLPTRPLEMPQDLAALPPPQPGTINRVDYRPKEEAIAGLTGRTTIATASGGPLVARTGQGAPGIRGELAAEDVTWRQTHHGLLLPRLLAKDKDTVVYGGMILDAPAEYDRLRAMGVQIPAAPPSALGQ